MAKTQPKTAGGTKKLIALLNAAPKQKHGMVFWTEHEGSQIIGTRHWFIRTGYMLPEIRTALATFGIKEPGKAFAYDSIVTAPDVAKLIPVYQSGYPTHLDDTRLRYECLAADIPMMRLLHDRDGKMHVVNNTFFDAIDAMFPYQPIFYQGGVIMFGETMLAVILPYGFPESSADPLEMYLKAPLALRYQIKKEIKKAN